MGVACPQFSDEPSYTMVESSGGSCRCTCQDEFQEDQEQSSGCCSPHVFTSILLGILSCVLMTGGVFLAFHKWDPMWLMVSGVGVVLILIGTILHCCNNMQQKPKRHLSAGKGCCPRPVPPDHNGHVINNNGSLTEQLLPLSNARSVSQLSLNMLPGYFPPVVTAYGIEQHSAVVQNINRLVQQQQQQQMQQQQQLQQQPQSPVSISPSVVGSTAGKSFILLSLPGDASATNIQNLVATVYQLDGNQVESTENETTQVTTPSVVCVKSNSPVPVILKSVEVQTCSMWPSNASSAVASTSGENSSSSHPPPITDNCAQATSHPVLPSASCSSTQTENNLPISENINLMDCSTDIAPICDNSTNTCDNQTTDSNCALVNIPASSSTDLLDMSVTNSTTNTESTNSVIIDIPVAPSDNILSSPTATDLLVDVVGGSPSAHPSNQPEILINISENPNAGTDSDDTSPLLENVVNNNISEDETVPAAINPSLMSANEIPQTVPENRNSDLQNLNPDLLASTSNLSGADSDIDDEELMERSSPPPTYEDVTLEGENVGAFGLAYGTI